MQPARWHSLFCRQMNLHFSLSVFWVRTCHPHLDRGPLMSLMLLPSLHSASPLPTPHTALVLGRMNHEALDPPPLRGHLPHPTPSHTLHLLRQPSLQRTTHFLLSTCCHRALRREGASEQSPAQLSPKERDVFKLLITRVRGGHRAGSTLESNGKGGTEGGELVRVTF